MYDGDELLERVRRRFGAAFQGDKRIAKLYKRIIDKSADLNDVCELSKACGTELSHILKSELTPDILMSEAFDYKAANTALQGSLSDAHKLVNLAAQAVQARIDEKEGLHLAAQEAEFPTERVGHIASSAADKTADKDTLLRRLTAPIENVTGSFYTDYVKENAEFRDGAGLKTYITRITNGKCCDWCAALAGRYELGAVDLPEHIWGFHDNCTCSVIYTSSKTTSRHSKRGKDRYKDVLTGEAREQAIQNAAKVRRLTSQEAYERDILTRHRTELTPDTAAERERLLLERRRERYTTQNLKAQLPKGFKDTRNIGTPISQEALTAFENRLQAQGITFANVKGSTHGGFETYCGDPKVLDDILDHVKNNQEILTKLSGNSKIIIGYDYLREGGNVEVDTFAQTTGRTIIFNKFMYDDSDYLKSEYNEAVASGRFAKGTTYLNVVDHEMGHVFARCNPRYISELNNVCESKAFNSGVSLSTFIVSNISSYADYQQELPAEINAMRYGNNNELALALLREAKLL